MENFEFTSFEEFKRNLGVSTIKFIKCEKREMALVYGIKMFTSSKIDWSKPAFVCKGEHNNLYVCNLREDRVITER